MTRDAMLRKFQSGMQVKVWHQHSYNSKKYADKVEGKCGVVTDVNYFYEKIAVKFDDLINDLSSSGDFFFRPRDLKFLDENGNIMEDESMANIKNYLNAIKIQYIDNVNPCTYIFANFEPDVKVGDMVVVKPAHHNIALAKVVEILEGTDHETSREVIAKVYTDAYDERVKVRTQAAELKNKMQERAKQLQDIALYQMLAKDDPAMLELLNEYQALTKA